MKLILYSKHNKVAHLQLNRSQNYNALVPELLQELYQRLKEVENDSKIRVLVLSGAGKGFCSGQDLKMVSTMSEIKASDFIRDYYKPVILKIREMKKPVLAMVHGLAAGAGISLALSCDMVFAASDSAFVPGFLNAGLIPDSGASWFISEALGTKKTFEFFASGKSLPASEAFNLGLINQVFPENTLQDQVFEWASRLAAGPTKALELMKKLIHTAPLLSLEEVIDMEADFQDLASLFPDFKEAIQAFAEKRKPNFL